MNFYVATARGFLRVYEERTPDSEQPPYMITRNIRLAHQFKDWYEADREGRRIVTKLADDGVLPHEQQYYAVLCDNGHLFCQPELRRAA